jgi:predicted nucleic acid-binding protein
VVLLADTGALIALLRKGDRHHAAAERLVRSRPYPRFLMSNLVLAELVTRLRALDGARAAADAGRRFLSSDRYEVLFVDEPLMSAALARLEQFHDKRLSLTDCVSFELMDRLRLPAAFAFDRDFRDCGYRMLP